MKLVKKDKYIEIQEPEISGAVDLVAMKPTINGCLPSFHTGTDHNTSPSIMPHFQTVSDPI
jgi:hypothetical protein